MNSQGESANVTLVRSILAAWGRGDYSSVEWADPAIQYRRADGLDAGVFTGKDVARMWSEFLNAWDEFRAEAEECRELDENRVLVLTRWLGRGRRSGLDLAGTGARGAALFEVHKGRVTRHTVWFDRSRALADLGPGLDA